MMMITTISKGEKTTQKLWSNYGTNVMIDVSLGENEIRIKLTNQIQNLWIFFINFTLSLIASKIIKQHFKCATYT